MKRKTLLLILLTFTVTLTLAFAQDNPPLILQTLEVVSVENNKVEVRFTFSQPLPAIPTNFSLNNPPRFVLDFAKIQNGLREKRLAIDKGIIRDYTSADIEGRTRVVLDLKQVATPEIKLNNTQLTLTFNSPGSKASPIMKDAPKSQTVNTTTTTTPTTVAKPIFLNRPDTSTDQSTTTDKKRLSFNFQDIKVRSAIQLIAEFTGLNIVISDTVQGSMSLHLDNIPWEQALDIILKTQGLGERPIGSTILIAPLDEIASRQKMELQAKQQIADLEPLHSTLVRINYSKADDLAKLLKDKGSTLLSSRGAVSVDARTNTLWILDTAEKLKETLALIKRLDTPSRQVLIETRIISIDKTYEEDLGVRFGVTSPNRLSGTLNAGNQMVGGTAPQSVLDPTLTNIDFTQRLNFNLPATPTSGAAVGSIGLALAKLFDNTFLDLELSALESEGVLQIISSPRLITSNQQSASISTGQDIPYQEKTSSGATSVNFKHAVLSLTVTPQITPDNRIVLALKINQDKRAPASQDVLGVPSINTNAIETNVLVNNSQTLVLGGIYEQTDNNSIQRIPFLGKIPVVGKLFTNTQDSVERFEILIFVTPKIIPQKPIKL